MRIVTIGPESRCAYNLVTTAEGIGEVVAAGNRIHLGDQAPPPPPGSDSSQGKDAGSVHDAGTAAGAKALTGQRLQDEIMRLRTGKPIQEQVMPSLNIPVLPDDTRNTGVSPSADQTHSSFSLSDLAYRESFVLGGTTETLSGAKERASEAVKNWPVTALELASGVVIGSALMLASRNPALAVPIKLLNRSMIALAVADMTARFAGPQLDAAIYPENLSKDRKALGYNLGSAMFDYSLAAVAGGAGARAAAPLVERTSVGSLLQGYDFFKTPAGVELRIFKSGNALVSQRGMRVFKQADPDLDMDPVRQFRSGIVGNNDLLRRTFGDGAAPHANDWKKGKDIIESAGNFKTWFESVTGALASELVDRTVDVGIGLAEHEYLKRHLQAGQTEDDKH